MTFLSLISKKKSTKKIWNGIFVLPQRLPTSAFLTCNLIVLIMSCYECMIPKRFSLPLKQKNTDNISLNRDERDAARLSRCCAVLAIWTLVPPWRSINADLPSHHHHSRHHKKPSAGTVTITIIILVMVIIITTTLITIFYDSFCKQHFFLGPCSM